MAKSPWGECARCGFKRRLSNFKREWSGQRVCSDCYDLKPVELSPPRAKPEGVPVHDAQPRTEDVFASYYDGSHL